MLYLHCCPLEVDPPWRRMDAVERTAFNIYACRTSLCDEVAKRLALEPDPNDFNTQCRIFDAVGLNSDTLTDYECEYIEKEVKKYR